MNQKQATYIAIVNALTRAGVAFSDGMDVGPHMRKEVRAAASVELVAGFREGKIELEREFDDTELKSYVSGLISNWVRKDKRLNGDTKYVPKNPGSRVGMTDSQLKALKQLLSTKSDPAERAEIQTFIDARVAELGASKAVAVNYDALPEALKAKYVG